MKALELIYRGLKYFHTLKPVRSRRTSRKLTYRGRTYYQREAVNPGYKKPNKPIKWRGHFVTNPEPRRTTNSRNNRLKKLQKVNH